MLPRRLQLRRTVVHWSFSSYAVRTELSCLPVLVRSVFPEEFWEIDTGHSFYDDYRLYGGPALVLSEVRVVICLTK